SGVLGAYLILFPGTSLVMGWFFLYFPMFFKLKAAYYLLFWFATQVIYGYARLGGSTAVFAHAGGFIAGIAILPLVASKERLIQFKLARQAAFPAYVVFTPTSVKTVGLGRATKIIIAVLLVALLLGAAYAATGLSIQGDVKSATVQYVFEGTPYVDYVGLQLPNIDSQLASISLDTTRILLNRLHVARLLYNENKVGENVSITDWNVKLQVWVKVGRRTVPVNVTLRVAYFDGCYDRDGFLNYGRGELATQIIRIDSYGIITLSDLVSYSFELSSQTVNLTCITQYTGVMSLVATAVALGVAVMKDRNLALIGEEPRKVWHPFTPVI
ncbi:MAG: rhomboid family intramembrane serine protease, partial [Candidatus Bathyarchaeia archaeon]